MRAALASTFRGVHVNGREREPRRRAQRELPASGSRVTVAQLRAIAPGSNREHEQRVEACLTYLQLQGVPAIPIHTGPRVSPNGAGGFDLRGNRRQVGCGDILGALPPDGRLLFIDVKTGRAQLSAEQRRLHRSLAAAGALCLVIRNVSDLEPHVRGELNRSRIQGGSG